MKQLLARGHEVIFFDYQNLLERIRSGYSETLGTSNREAYRIALETEILLLDDLGAHRVGGRVGVLDREALEPRRFGDEKWQHDAARSAHHLAGPAAQVSRSKPPGSRLVGATAGGSPDWLLGPLRIFGVSGTSGPLFYAGLWVALVLYVVVLLRVADIPRRAAIWTVAGLHDPHLPVSDCVQRDPTMAQQRRELRRLFARSHHHHAGHERLVYHAEVLVRARLGEGQAPGEAGCPPLKQ